MISKQPTPTLYSHTILGTRADSKRVSGDATSGGDSLCDLHAVCRLCDMFVCDSQEQIRNGDKGNNEK